MAHPLLGVKCVPTDLSLIIWCAGSSWRCLHKNVAASKMFINISEGVPIHIEGQLYVHVQVIGQVHVKDNYL